MNRERKLQEGRKESKKKGKKEIAVIIRGMCTIQRFHWFMLTGLPRGTRVTNLWLSFHEYLSSHCNFMVENFISVEDGPL
jgi:hypothetical protein